jgi:hypothetical protein
MTEKERIEERILQNKQDRARLRNEAEALEKALAAAIAPKYKHGDMFYMPSGTAHLCVKVDGEDRILGASGTGSGNPNHYRGVYDAPGPVVGNILRLMEQAGPTGRVVALSAQDLERMQHLCRPLTDKALSAFVKRHILESKK